MCYLYPRIVAQAKGPFGPKRSRVNIGVDHNGYHTRLKRTGVDALALAGKNKQYSLPSFPGDLSSRIRLSSARTRPLKCCVVGKVTDKSIVAVSIRG